MNFLDNLDNMLEERHLLKHSFYTKFNNGIVSKDILCTYAEEYYHHVAAFPRYISQIHSLCSDLKSRQVLLANLVDEEQGEDNHPELWLRFIEGLGGSRDVVNSSPKLTSTFNLVDGFFNLVRANYGMGLGALYAYERQTPEVSMSKICALKEHYGICDDRTLEFFSLHGKVDIWHTEELRNLIKEMKEEDLEQVFIGAKKGAELLWCFLDGIESYASNCCSYS